MSFDDWNFKQVHTITASVALTDYQLKFRVYKGSGTSSGNEIYCNGKCKDDFSDIRFTIDDTSALPYWIESYTNGVSADIWVKFSTINTTQQITVNYNNANATSLSNGANTFLFFDDFSTNRIGSIWSETYDFNGSLGWLTTHTIENGGYHMAPTAGSDTGLLAYLTSALSINSVVQLTLDYTNRGGNRSPTWLYLGCGYGTSYHVFGYFGSVYGGLNPSAPSDIIKMVWSDGYTTNNIKMYRGDTLINTQSASFATNKKPSFGMRSAGGNNEYVNAYFKNMLVCKYAASEPVHSTWNAEQQYVKSLFVSVKQYTVTS